MLLACSVNTPIDDNRSHLLRVTSCVLCELGPRFPLPQEKHHRIPIQVLFWSRNGRATSTLTSALIDLDVVVTFGNMENSLFHLNCQFDSLRDDRGR